MNSEANTGPTVVVMSDWDGVHLWFDTLRRSCDPDQFDLRFRGASPAMEQVHYGVRPGTAITAPAHGLTIDWNAGDSDLWLPVCSAVPALREMRFVVPSDAPAAIDAVFAEAVESGSLVDGAILVGRTQSGATVDWQVVGSPVSRSPGVVRVTAAYHQILPGHLLATPGACEIFHKSHRFLVNEAAYSDPWLVGPVAPVTPRCLARVGPIRVAVRRPGDRRVA